MKLTPQEKADRKAAFKRMDLPARIDYIFSYYKLPLVLLLIAVIFLVTVAHHYISKKHELLYLGVINVSVGDDLMEPLTEGFVEHLGVNPKKNEVYTYRDLYISENPAPEFHQYAYTSRLKMLAAINAKQVDVVLMNRESYDLFSHSGYLLDLASFLQEEDPELFTQLQPLLTENEVILEDNAEEMTLGTADSYQAEAVSCTNGLAVSDLPFFASAHFPEPVYLCVIANSTHLPAVLSYIRYLALDGRK